MTEKQKRKLTLKKFAEYEKEICKKQGFSKGVWRSYRNDIMWYSELYDPNVNYAGRGDSREFNITEKIVPELYDNFIFFVHDRFYDLIYKANHKHRFVAYYQVFKPRADRIMKDMMEIKAKRPTILPEIYHFFVKWFG